ncbi:MAG: hypothetical protein KDA61_07965 [Planctomycetales bacterium]|nr:hypothetical protein [Planctomycetales bacterium]
MENDNPTQCSTCGSDMQEEQLMAKAIVGPLNFLTGFSVGSFGTLAWRPTGAKRWEGIELRGSRFAARRCPECGTTLLKT